MHDLITEFSIFGVADWLSAAMMFLLIGILYSIVMAIGATRDVLNHREQ